MTICACCTPGWAKRTARAAGARWRPETSEQIVEQVLGQEPGSQWLILAPLARNRKGEYQDVFTKAKRDGFARVRVNGQVRSLDEQIVLNKKLKHAIDIVVDRFIVPSDPSEEKLIGSRVTDCRSRLRCASAKAPWCSRLSHVTARHRRQVGPPVERLAQTPQLLQRAHLVPRGPSPLPSLRRQVPSRVVG